MVRTTTEGGIKAAPGWLHVSPDIVSIPVFPRSRAVRRVRPVRVYRSRDEASTTEYVAAGPVGRPPIDSQTGWCLGD